MTFITLNEQNLEKEHICCAISASKGDVCAAAKKAWLKERFAEGLVFTKLDARGKVFIEYIPAEQAWCPIEAEGYLHINCLWVSGQFKGQGLGSQLLESCIADAKAKGKQGLTVLSSPKKKPFLSDPVFLKRKGFVVADTAAPDFELLYLPFKADAPKPRFAPQAKDGRTNEPGLVLYYTHQCPHTAKYAPLLEQAALRHGAPVRLHLIASAAEAQSAPCPCTTYSLFWNGEFITNEILSVAKAEALLSGWGCNAP